MKRWYLVALLAAPLFGARPDAAKIDPPGGSILPASGGAPVAPTLNGATVLFVDTALNQYTIWTNVQRNIFAKGDTVVGCYRRVGDGTLGSGALGLSWSVDGGMTWTTMWPINGSDIGGSFLGRYPHAVLGDVPGCSWPELASGGWGYEGAFAAAWDGTTGAGEVNTAQNDEVHKHIAYPFGASWIGAGFGAGATSLFVSDFDPSGGFFNNIQASASTVDPEVFRLGADGNLYLFGVDQATQEFAVAAYDPNTGDFGSPITLVPSTPPSFVEIWWVDGTVLSDGTVLFAIAAKMDAAFGMANALYLYRYDPNTQTTDVIQIDDPATDHYIHYPNLVPSATGGKVALLWAQADTSFDSNIGGYHWDLYVTWSDDGGVNWVAPQMISDTAVTEYSPHANGFLSGNTLYFLYGVSADDQNYPNWDGFYQVLDTVTSALVPTALHFAKVDLVSVEEGSPVSRPEIRMVVDLSGHTFRLFGPSGLQGQAEVRVVDAAGREVRRFALTLRNGEGAATFGTLAKGTYLVRVALPNGEQVSGKIWVAR